MTAGIGLGETTPGPLVLVLQFVGFLAGYNNPGTLPPLAAGLIGALIAAWMTFIPSFLFIFLGAPFAERLRANAGLANALTAVSAAVVGVILDLALWLAVHTFFARVSDGAFGPLSIWWPELGSVNWTAIGIAAIAAVLVFRAKAPTLVVVGISAVLGCIAALAGLA
jgi:chromate transporter